MRKTLTGQQKREIAARTYMSQMTIYKLMKGMTVLEATRMRVVDAMRAMGLDPAEYMPPEHKADGEGAA